MTQAQAIADQKSRRPSRKERRRAQKLSRRQGKAAGSQAAALIREAAQHHVAGRLSEAEALYRRVLADDPRHFAAASRLGAIHAQERRWEEARRLLEQAIEIEPGHGPTRMNLGIVYSAQGDSARADEQFRAGIELDPDDPETLINYGSWCHKAGRIADAASALERGLELAPDKVDWHKVLSVDYVALGRIDDAIARLRKVLELAPDDLETHGNLGTLLAHQGEAEAAVGHLGRGFAKQRDKQDYQQVLIETLREAPVEAMDESFNEILRYCFETGLVELQRMSAPSGAFLWLKYCRQARLEERADGGPKQVHFDGILGDPLLIQLLQKVVNINMGLETILVPLRHVLLFKAASEPSLSARAMTFMASFAMQCHNNSYVFPVSAEELEEVARLEDELAERVRGSAEVDAALETRLSLYAMYRPLHRLPGFERLLQVPLESWSDALRPMIVRSLHNPAEEERLKATIPHFGSIDDSVSKAVRSQYEENPYPRWVSLPKQPGVSLEQHVRGEFGSVAMREPPPGEGLDCLVAGCGTGRHPISVALRLPQARITAVDLSLASMAYAKRMARSLEVSNIAFLHGDLLDLGELGQDFQMIECSGVLHHMKEPERGLESLLRVLRPGGYLRLGLYSRTARRKIIETRAQIRELGLSPTPDAIRAFRHEMMRKQVSYVMQYSSLTDFFDLDSLRDLLFHVQEHQFSIPELEAMLARHGLTFLGFSALGKSVFRAFAERFPAPESLQDLAAWHAFEEDNPDTFISMYQFWCHKPA